MPGTIYTGESSRSSSGTSISSATSEVILEGVRIQHTTHWSGVGMGIGIASFSLQVQTMIVYTYTAECCTCLPHTISRS